MQTYNAALELNRISRDVDYELHKVEEQFDRLRSDLTTLIEAKFSNLPQGLLQFQPKFLLAPGMSYLRLDLGGPNDHVSGGSRCSFSVIDILSDGDKTVAVERCSGVSNVIDNHSASPWQSIPQEVQNLGWRGLEYCNASTSRGRIHMIPLDLAAGTPAHPILFGLADFARSIVDGNCKPYRRLAEASTELDEIAEAADVARRDTQALLQSIEVGKNCDVPDALVQDLRTMDWTYHYACRPAAASGDKELRIRQGLARLDLNLAVRTFIDNAGANWPYVFSYLRTHPSLGEHLKKAA